MRRSRRRCALNDAIARLRRDGPQLELARALRQLGEIDRWPPSRDAGRRPYEEAVAILRELDEPLELAHAIRHLGDVHHDTGRLGPTRECYEEALALYRRHADAQPLDIANTIRSLALLESEVGAIGAAARLWREAHALYATVDVPAGVAESAANLALLAQAGGDTERARAWLDAADAAATAVGDRDSLQFVRTVKARIEGAGGNA